ncbi:MAG: PQQ-like beta-propeller repeat protein, partial [Planctomycetales bacterium]
WLEETELQEQATITSDDSWAVLVRGSLPGAGAWTHLYGNPGNTASSNDYRVQGGLGVLWYGDPGAGKMVNRHDSAVGPLAVNGRLFIQGENSVMAYDAYNGLFLWERENPQAQRTGVFNNFNPGNLAASDDRLFMMIGNQCLELDGATGELTATHHLPSELDQQKYQWGYLAYENGIIFGTATIRKEIEERLRRRGRTHVESTDALFAIDMKTGQHLWTHKGGSISHHTIVLGRGSVFYVNSSVTSEQRAALLAQDKSELKKLSDEEARQAEQQMKQLDMRMVVGLNERTGEQLWEVPVDVTDCSEIGIGGGQLTLMYQNDVLLLCGANANGHYWKQFLAGDFSRRRLVALAAGDGNQLWAKDANYRHRPIIIGNQIIAEPWGFDLYTGEQKMRAHPLTGQPEPWSFVRPG